MIIQNTYQVCVPGGILCPQTLEANTPKGVVQIQMHAYDTTLGACSLLYLSCLSWAIFHPQTPYSVPGLQILRSLLCLELAQPVPSLAIKSFSFTTVWGGNLSFHFYPIPLFSLPQHSLHFIFFSKHVLSFRKLASGPQSLHLPFKEQNETGMTAKSVGCWPCKHQDLGSMLQIHLPGVVALAHNPKVARWETETGSPRASWSSLHDGGPGQWENLSQRKCGMSWKKAWRCPLTTCSHGHTWTHLHSLGDKDHDCSIRENKYHVQYPGGLFRTTCNPSSRGSGVLFWTL